MSTETSLKIKYPYEDGSDNNVRLTKMTYPDGRELNYDYGSAGSADDALSRVASLIDDDGSTHLVDYTYLGRNTFVKTDYREPDLRYDLAMGVGDDPYDGFDRFGRIVDSRWYDSGSSADVDRILYGYDRASNRTYREQTCDSNSYHDEVYGYDDVNRLTDFDRGTINGNKDGITTLTFAQEWSLDPTGNWSAFKEDDDGDSSWDLDQSRTSNEVNEIIDITETSGPSWATPAYNRAGNMTTIPKPADPTSSYAATYDGWNHLTKLEEGEDTVAEYVYDGVKRRIVQKTYDSGELDRTRHFYYTDPQKWQVIEERFESGGSIFVNSDRQFVWGLRDINDLVLRDRDTDANGTLDERLFALQDGNWNVSTLVDDDGDIQERYAYAAYGAPRVLTPTFTTRASSNCEVEVLYAGYRYEGAIGLYDVRHRVYQAQLGHWAQRDPAIYQGGIDLYQYCRADPLSAIDPDGTRPVMVTFGAFIGGWRGAWLPQPRVIVGGWQFKTDQRGFGGGTYRLAGRVLFDTKDIGRITSANSNGYVFSSGSTRRRWTGTGWIYESSRAKVTSVVGFRNLNAYHTEWRVAGSAGYPFILGSNLVSAIDFSVRIHALSLCGVCSVIWITGWHDAFPDYEARVTGGFPTQVYSYISPAPGPGVGPGTLGAGGNVTFASLPSFECSVPSWLPSLWKLLGTGGFSGAK